MDLNYTPEDVEAAALFLRSQAPRLPHAQRRAALAMARMFTGIDLKSIEHPEFGEVGGTVGISIPVFYEGEFVGSVDFTIQGGPSTQGEGCEPVVVSPMGGEDFFRRWGDEEEEVEETVDAVPGPPLTLVPSSGQDVEGECRVDPNTHALYVKSDAMSSDTMAAVSWPDGSNQKIVPMDVWNSWDPHGGDS